MTNGFFQCLKYPVVVQWRYNGNIIEYSWNTDAMLIDIPSGVIKYGKLGNPPTMAGAVVRWENQL